MIHSVTVKGKDDAEVMVAVDVTTGRASVTIFEGADGDGERVRRVVLTSAMLETLIGLLGGSEFRQSLYQGVMAEDQRRPRGAAAEEPPLVVSGDASSYALNLRDALPEVGG